MSIRVMIVDDSRFIYEEMVFLLENTDFEIVRYCRSGEEAVEAYGEVRPDLVTMDIILPGIDGFESTRAILKKYPDARVVFVSSLAYDETIEEARGLGSQEFLFKPFEKKRLIDTLMRASGRMEAVGA